MKKKFLVSLHTILNFILLVLVALLLIFSVLLVREKLTRNTYEMGVALTKSYAVETELRLDDYQKALNLGKQYVEQMEQEGATIEEIHEWIKDYSDKLTKMFDDHKIDPFAVIDGEIVSSKPWIVEEGYDHRKREWYQDTIEANGEMIFTDVYEDSVTGEMVFSICQMITKSGDALALDIYLENTDALKLTTAVPEKYHFFLMDSKGNFVASTFSEAQEGEAGTAYINELLTGIEGGSLLAYNATIMDPQGLDRGVYVENLNNGWTVIMTIPIEDILMGEQSPTIFFLALLSAALFLILLSMIIRDAQSRKQISEDSNTIQILSEAFYAIYRVNIENGTYVALKTSPDLVGVLPKEGDYSLVLNKVKELVHPKTYEDFEQSFCIPSIRERVAENMLDYGGDYQRRFGDTYKWVNIRTIYKKELAPHEVVLCFREVDAEKQQQLQHIELLQDALDTAKRSVNAKAAFFSNMSHDMRTPLNAIIGFSSLAQQSPEDCEKQQEYMKKIGFSAKQLLNLINDILEVSKMEAGRSVIESQVFNLKEYTMEVSDLFRTQAAQESKAFSTKLYMQNDMVKGDPFKISQILNNILSNAFKYTNKGDSVSLEIRQFDYQNYSKYQFVISDTGIGMSEEFVKRIFDPYTRETHFSAKSAAGTGLGMTIVKNLVSQMNGEIFVESRLGEGSRFTVTIPLETVEQEVSVSEKNYSEETNITELTGRKILVAEDNELNMEIIVTLLTMNGIEVVQAHNGEEAVELFRAAPPYSVDAVLMDMQMPVMDGCEAAAEIRRLNRPDAAKVPIIAVTANAFAEDIAKTTNAGMNGHISKPVDFEALKKELLVHLQEGAEHA